MALIDQMAGVLSQVRALRPLVHQITNYVSVNDCANIVLAYGGAPVMADDAEEVVEMVAIASVLVLNIGTLNSRTIQAMLLAGQEANVRGIPVVLDPVGVGATRLRTDTAQRIMAEVKLAVIRGNASEIAVLAGEIATTRGVDAGSTVGNTMLLGQELATRLGAVVAITGAQDIITDGCRIILCDNGHPLLTRVTGTGCMVSALVGAGVGVTADYLLAAAAGVVSMGLAGEYAAEASSYGNLGAFRSHIIDFIGNIAPSHILAGARIQLHA
ncbi:MAG: Hydroxyethylthiazole kinase [Firmicutes bacterium]|nr:Hydroxyethylthiazole kinase [Bacillota bacterium]